ncbi:MAG: ABC transporter permease [Pseudomonadota bacterium]|nr:ABC transporter permease [Pseudomonadota bacterium]
MLLKLALRNILRQKRRSLLTGLSISGGFVLSVFSFSLTEGTYENAIDFFTRDHTGHIQIHSGDYHERPKIYKTISQPEAVEAIIKNESKIKAFAPRIFAPALAYAGSETSVVSVIGVDPFLESKASRIEEKVSSGKYFDQEPTGRGLSKVMIGAGVSVSLDVGVGDEIVLISQGADGSIANDLFEVVATVGTKSSFDNMVVYLPLDVAQDFISVPNEVHEYVLVTANASRSVFLATILQQRIDLLDVDLTVSPWQVIESSFYKSMRADQQGNYFILAIIIFLVCIGVLNTVLMSVLERTREFGVLIAIGSRPNDIFKMIFIETILLATLSMLFGLILVVPLLIFLTQIGFALPEPIDMGGVQFHDLKGSVSVTVLLGPALIIYGFASVVTIIPGFRACNITPKVAMSSH